MWPPGPHVLPPSSKKPQLPASPHEGSRLTSEEGRGLPPRLERKDPVPVRYTSKPSGRRSGTRPRPTQEDNEQVMVHLYVRMYMYIHEQSFTHTASYMHAGFSGAIAN